MRNQIPLRLSRVAPIRAQAVRCGGPGYLGYVDPTFFEPSHVIFMCIGNSPKLHDRVKKRWDLRILGILASVNSFFARSENLFGQIEA